MTFILLKRESKYSESKLLPCFLIYQWYFGIYTAFFSRYKPHNSLFNRDAFFNKLK